MCSQETKLRKAESLRSPERLILSLRYYLAVLPAGRFVALKKPKRPMSRPLRKEWNVYLWAARRILQVRAKRGSGNELWWCLPHNSIQNLYLKTGLDLTDQVVAARFKAIPPFFRLSSTNLQAFLAQYPVWFERLRRMLIEHYGPRRYERKRTSYQSL
jgi:hypothetical protein